MNSNPYPQPVGYLHLGFGDTPIRTYCFFPINTAVLNHPEFDPRMLAQSMRNNYRLSYPYTWCIYGTRTAVVVNINDLHVHETRYGLPPTYHIPFHPYDAAYVVPHSNSSSTTTNSGLTTKDISNNLQLTDYCKEDEDEEEGDVEICAVCLVEFEKNERLGVLQCKHRYHPECITRWLIRQNVCPLCKGEGLRV